MKKSKVFNLKWIADPSTGIASVSLTNFVLSVIFLLVVSVLQLMGKVDNTSIAVEYFVGSGSLYFGRRLSFGNKEATVEEEDKDVNK